MELRAELQEQLLAREELEEMLRRRERELTALKGALKEEVASHDQEVDKLKEQNQKEISRLQTSLEEAQQVVLSLLPLCSPPHHTPPLLPPHTPSLPRPAPHPAAAREIRQGTEGPAVCLFPFRTLPYGRL